MSTLDSLSLWSAPLSTHIMRGEGGGREGEGVVRGSWPGDEVEGVEGVEGASRPSHHIVY